MVGVHYADIAHLIRDIQVASEEALVHLVSDCGTWEKTVSVPRSSEVVAEPVQPKSLFRSWLAAALQRVLRESPCQAVLLPDERERLSLRAFEEVATGLARVDGRWIALSGAEHPSDFFERQLSAAPITEPYDLEVLVRVLLEVSRSDSHWRCEEKAFLEEIVSDHASIERLKKAPNLTVAELAEVSSLEVKQTILMLAWAMAYADGTLDLQEMARLTQLCRGFMLAEKRVRELQLAAKLSLLNRFLQSERGRLSNEELRQRFDQKALEWGVCEQNLCKLRAWYPQDFPADSASVELLRAEDDELLL